MIVQDRTDDQRSSVTGVLYIAGSGRNGSTLFERMVAQVPGVAGGGELKFFWNRGVVRDERCGCGDAFSECPLWRDVTARLLPADVALAPDAARRRQAIERTRRLPALLRRSSPEQIRDYCAQEAAVITALGAAHSARVVVDSSNDPIRALGLAKSESLRIVVVHLVRDSRAVAASWQRVRPREAASHRGKDLMPTYSPPRSALQWVRAAILVSVARGAGLLVVRLRYEDFVADPSAALRRVLAAHGIRPSTSDLAFIEGRTAELGVTHTVSGNPSRFRTGPSVIEEDQGWRSELTVRERLVVEALTLPWLLWYGYVPARRSRRRAPG